MRRSHRLALGGLLCGLVLVGAALVRPGGPIAAVRALADDPLLFGLVVAGLYAIRPAFLWPTTPLAVLVGYGLGVTIGLPVALAGVLLTVTPVYLAVRHLGGRRATRGRVGRTVDRYFRATGSLRGTVAAVVVGASTETALAAGPGGVGVGVAIAGTVAALALVAGPLLHRHGRPSARQRKGSEQS